MKKSKAFNRCMARAAKRKPIVQLPYAKPAWVDPFPNSGDWMGSE